MNLQKLECLYFLSILSIFNLEKWFNIEKIVYSDGKIKGKPHPEIYEIACKNIGVTPQECVVIEDAISGIESAHNAKIGKIIAIH